ncbi:Prephenate dehydrogenase [Thermoanaerobacter mathranii subsp. mathranii str. A3]|jgi:prephenate dehydrogenase|uniref:Prephenate dehydrogenase n=3 Tax=Thermoanaerobacter TaxID=1754 RepID=D3T8G3_THEIA|nr:MULTISPECIES: prephenate dehydrogenase/arogenate dehydrogenase family protein [Thermoanaerobacter]MDI3501605.1 prephenate dehydrogenase [Thermoanaerobacter sp.]ADD02245.1 Prephenate dehydrogenase [Thermoanaerobacter italicus Ab9]ADH60751.1 Prephenate dehydrogenase [Thermoanaerobacter mathranii subsp. mathranii str. A3]MBT1279557.1 prephenate dehydrogenase/arogenate dehydrogenase family protein [Thermoanaerobacter sp. CM-CNRG TB177]MDP9749571.1 prephenate dehydrogenase [Thermoanaerobacter pe
MIRKAVIIGLGLIGGSLAKALKKYTDINIIAVDINRDNLRKALEEGVISYGMTHLDFQVDTDVVFICTPVGKVVESVKNIIPYLKRGCIVTDVGSTKKVIMEEVQKFLPDEIFFIGGHPMAGTEKAGYDNADADLFVNSNYLLTPSDIVKEDILELFIDEVIIKIGAKPVIMDYNKHDAIVGVISHVPHIISAILTNFAYHKCSEAFKYAAGGFKDTTRIALSQTEIWKDIICTNKEIILDLLKNYKEVLSDFICYLENDDIDSIQKFLEDARKYRNTIT